VRLHSAHDEIAELAEELKKRWACRASVVRDGGEVVAQRHQLKNCFQ